MSKHMDLGPAGITPPSLHAAIGETVELRAHEDCTVVFSNGLGLHMKKNDISSLVMSSNGSYAFELYPDVPATVRETVMVAQVAGSGSEVITESVMMAKAVPTGNILVP
jgi:hypothetical protein